MCRRIARRRIRSGSRARIAGALVLDADGREVAPAEKGVLYISGPSVFAGYWNRPAETAAVFLERDGIRWYNTGDVVRFDPADGFTYVGRQDRMVKRRGYRIELGEIESALHAHPRLREAAVVSMPDADAGVKIDCVRVVCRRAAAVDRRAEDVLRDEGAGVHESRSLCLPRSAAAYLERQDRLPGAAGSAASGGEVACPIRRACVSTTPNAGCWTGCTCCARRFRRSKSQPT